MREDAVKRRESEYEVEEERERGSIKEDATGLESLFPLVASARSID